MRWSTGDFVCDVNGDIYSSSAKPGCAVTFGVGGWRDVFTFQTEIFFPLWGPVFLGWFTILQHLQGRQWQSIYASWPRVFLWHLFLGLFAGLGYAGNLGIIVGFCQIFGCALFALLISLGGGGHSRTHLELHIRGMDRPKTMALGGAEANVVLKNVETHDVQVPVAAMAKQVRGDLSTV